MNKLIIKCVALVMALCMMATLAACGGDDDATKIKDQTTGAVTTTTASADDPDQPEDKSTTAAQDNQSRSNASRTARTTTARTKSNGDNGNDGSNSGLPANLNGATVNVAGMSTCYFSLDATKSEWNRQIRNELSAIEKSLNCKFKVTNYDSSALTTNLVKADRAGSKFADLVLTTIWQQRPLMSAKALTDLNTVSGLDLTKSYFDQAARKEMQLYGKNFIAFTTLDGTAANANVLFFNKVLAKQVGTSDKELYKMVHDGKWTFAKMRDLSAKALKDIDGKAGIDYSNKSGKDQYGFTGCDIRGGVSYSIFKAQGGYFTKTSSNGDVTYALGDSKNISALTQMQKWLLGDKSVFNSDKDGNNHAIGAEIFKDGRVLFLGWSADSATNWTEMKNDWGVLPYPKDKEGGKYTSVISWNTQGFCIPRKVKGTDLRNAAAVMDAIARQFNQIRDRKDAYLKSRVFRDTESQKMLKIAEESASIDFCQFGDLGAGGLSTIHYLFDDISRDPAQRVASVREEAVSALNNFLKNVK
ncbi:MAG: hypothetical protein ACOYJY_01325 [Acutalibacteraceae bacterium]|jgi:hypothetical protein